MRQRPAAASASQRADRAGPPLSGDRDPQGEPSVATKRWPVMARRTAITVALLLVISACTTSERESNPTPPPTVSPDTPSTTAPPSPSTTAPRATTDGTGPTTTAVGEPCGPEANVGVEFNGEGATGSIGYALTLVSDDPGCLGTISGWIELDPPPSDVLVAYGDPFFDAVAIPTGNRNEEEEGKYPGTIVGGWVLRNWCGQRPQLVAVTPQIVGTTSFGARCDAPETVAVLTKMVGDESPFEILPIEDTVLPTDFVRATRTEVTMSQLPFTDHVALGLGSDLLRTVHSATLENPREWNLEQAEFRGYEGPFSAYESLARPGAVIFTIGEHKRCVSPPEAAPEGYGAYKRISIQPALITSCLQWFSVDLFVNDVGLIEAVTFDVDEP